MNSEEKKKYMKEWKEKNKEKVREYQKEYNKEYYQKNKDEMIGRVNKYYKNHIEEHNGYVRKYREKNKNTSEYKESRNNSKRKWCKNNPEIVRARNQANYHLKSLKKEGYEFHHPDYSKPLLVEILSIKEHRELHQNVPC